MGFALKPGRPHDNGIRNQHVKFENGTELELLTAERRSIGYLAQGDGPAHVVLYAPDSDRPIGVARAASDEIDVADPDRASSAKATSRAVWKRSVGFFSRQ